MRLTSGRSRRRDHRDGGLLCVPKPRPGVQGGAPVVKPPGYIRPRAAPRACPGGADVKPSGRRLVAPRSAAVDANHSDVRADLKHLAVVFAIDGAAGPRSLAYKALAIDEAASADGRPDPPAAWRPRPRSVKRIRLRPTPT